MKSFLITCTHTHTGTVHGHSHQLIWMQTRGEINANRSKGNEQLLFHSVECCIGKRWKHPHRAAGWMDGRLTASLLTLVELVQAA